MNVTDEMVDVAWKALDDALNCKLDGTEYCYGDHTPMKHALEQVFALSHAAGQDSEQCRAASGEREALATRLRELICEYWDLAYDEGVDKRNSDTPAGDANRVANEIETIIRALSRGVPEGMVLVPRSSAEMAAVVCDEWGELFVGTPGFDKYERFNYGPAVEMLRDELRAIAAQRKE